ncbi:MAG TPA: hypothetical protein VNM39_10815, partial [Verrucomicrobiae bacterium]|nr:hypothetical protein [Verrucomicrobiae bacterium]
DLNEHQRYAVQGEFEANPRGMLRTRATVAHLERRTVTYCRLGESHMKPTDLWGVFPPGLNLPEPCDHGPGVCCREVAKAALAGEGK